MDFASDLVGGEMSVKKTHFLGRGLQSRFAEKFGNQSYYRWVQKRHVYRHVDLVRGIKEEGKGREERSFMSWRIVFGGRHETPRMVY